MNKIKRKKEKKMKKGKQLYGDEEVKVVITCENWIQWVFIWMHGKWKMQTKQCRSTIK